MRDHDSIVGVDQAILTHAHGVPALPQARRTRSRRRSSCET